MWNLYAVQLPLRIPGSGGQQAKAIYNCSNPIMQSCLLLTFAREAEIAMHNGTFLWRERDDIPPKGYHFWTKKVQRSPGRAPGPPRHSSAIPFNHNHISYKFVQHRERKITTWYFNF